MSSMINNDGIQVDLRDEAEPMIMVEGVWVIMPEAPEPVITERDLHPSQWEGVEGYTASQDDHDQMEAMYVDFAERVW